MIIDKKKTKDKLKNLVLVKYFLRKLKENLLFIQFDSCK